MSIYFSKFCYICLQSFLNTTPLTNSQDEKLCYDRNKGCNGSMNKLSLTQRELDVLNLLMQGKNNRDIAKQLLITHHTVKAHISAILKKTGTKSRVEAIVYVLNMKK